LFIHIHFHGGRYLSKLPPIGNTVVTWKRRWFKLTLSLYSTPGDCPVTLEYFASPAASKAKGAIALDRVTAIGPVDAEDLANIKVLRNVPPVSQTVFSFF
jgi:hypothetical protein